METIEQLKQENEKLNVRLAKAVEVFKEQKANIEAVTKERDNLQEKYDDVFEAAKNLGLEIAQLKTKIHEQENIVDQDATINELRNEIESKNKAYKILQDTYNELFANNTKLKEQLEQRLKQVRAVENTTNEEVKKVTAARDEWITKYKDLEDELTDLKSINKEINILKGEAELKLSTIQKEYEDKFNEMIASKDSQINEFISNVESLQMSLTKAESDLEIVRKSDKEYREAFEQQKKENKETEKQFNKVLSIYEDDIKELKDKYEDLHKQYDSLTTQHDKLSKKYDNLENEKLGWEKEFIELEEKYKNLQSQTVADHAFESYLTDTIFNIWTICDDILNSKPSAEEIKEKIRNDKTLDEISVKNSPNPKKLISNSTGNQFMSDATGMNI